MSEEKKGKQYAGQSFPLAKTTEEVAKEQELQKQYDSPDAVSLEVYFAMKSDKDQQLFTNPVMREAMKAHTTVRRATFAQWEEIFKSF